MSNDTFDFGSILDEAFTPERVEFRDPYSEEWGQPSKWTKSQIEAYQIWQAHQRPKVALIGAKGSGKTYLGAMIAAYQMQKYPGSIGMVCSNTFGQVKRTALKHVITVFNSLGLNFSVHKSITIDNQMYDQVIVLHLSPTLKSYLCLVSFENISTIEGSEWDWQWFEEIQDTEREKYSIASSRRRGTKANRGIYIAGMPADEFHWMYQLLPSQGFCKPEDAQPGQKAHGCFLEPKIFENLENVGQDYIDDLYATLGPLEAKRFIYGERVSLNTNKVFYTYNPNKHKSSWLARELTKYDPARRLFVSFDFNVAPMSVSLWQIKPFSLTDDNYQAYVDLLDRQADFEYGPGDGWDILAQVGEYEMWQGGTPAVMDRLVEDYGGHVGGVTVLGDRSGNTTSTQAPGVTDYGIIRDRLNRAKIHGYSLIPGLVQNADVTTGDVKYSNPPVKDTINKANGLLYPLDQRIRVVFLPTSEFASGGVATSVAAATFTPDGRIDESNDRKEDRTLPRSHFTDTFRYICWYFGGGSSTMTTEDFRKLAQSLKKAAKTSPKKYGGRGRAYGGSKRRGAYRS